MKVAIDVSFGCALWLQRQLSYNRWDCGRVSRKTMRHACTCSPTPALCVEPLEAS